MLCSGLNGKEVLGRIYTDKDIDIDIYMAESLCCPPETITTLFIGILQYKIQSLRKKQVIYGCITHRPRHCISGKKRKKKTKTQLNSSKADAKSKANRAKYIKVDYSVASLQKY